MPHAGYSNSYEKAAAAMRNLTAPPETAKRCGTVYNGNGFDLAFFGNPCRVRLPECDFVPADLSLGEKILILHYLLSEGPLEENPPLATFEGLQGGMFYFKTFKKRGPNRVLNDFKDDPSRLERIAEASRWPMADIGEVSIVIPVLPLIDLTVAYYLADEEFPPEVKFLFRKDISSLLPLEDVAVLGGIAATRLAMKRARCGL